MATERDYSSMTTQVLHGGQIGFSYQGPLHFGMSTSSHPFRTDRRWTQVNAGLGYDRPLHSLKPGKVSVRASAGPNAGLDLEFETPFHRTDKSHLRGIEWSMDLAGAGYEMQGSLLPSGTGDILGQWMLRANIWSPEISLHTALEQENLRFVDGELHGPAVEDSMIGGDGYEAYYLWQDHPTDRFHAGAIPLDLGSNQLAFADEFFARSDLNHPLDYIANVEQLQSSVDVHINKGTLPYFDSGTIVSATGIGLRDTAQGGRIEPQMGAFKSHSSVSGQPAPTEWFSMGTDANAGHGLGLGQRILRTNDGTLHQFVLGRTATQSTDAASTPVWIHHKKPLHGDLFWSSRHHQTNDFVTPPTWTGYDEVGPDLSSLTSVTELRVHGAAFAADSKGAIHAVIEVCDSTNDGHSLYYHKAERKSHAQAPHPVFDWDWSLTSASKILGPTNGSLMTFGEDFREPSLVIDAHDTLHLAYVVADDASPFAGHIYYTQMREGESFSSFDATVGSSGTRHQLVSNPSETSNTTSAPSYVTEVDKPKVMLRSDGVPVILYRGAQSANTDVTRRATGVFVNISDGLSTSDSLYTFTASLSKPVAGLRPQSDVTLSNSAEDGVRYYDSVIDEHDVLWTVSVMVTDTLGQVNGSGEPRPYLTRVNSLDAKQSLASQYDSTSNGLGFSTTLFHAPPITSGDEGLDAGFHSPTITTDGNGNIHVIACARYEKAYSATLGDSGSDAIVNSPLLRNASPNTTEHAPYPLQAPALKAGDQSLTTAQSNDSDEGGYGPESATLASEVDGWSGMSTVINRYTYEHLIEMWWSGNEYSTPASGEWVIRNVNFRWLSTPSMRYNSTTSSFIPLGQNDTISGNEDFTHTAPQLRAQRFHGFDASYLDLSWITNEKAWQWTPHKQVQAFYPHMHPIGTSAEPSSDEWDSATHKLGVAGYPNQ